MQTEKQRERSVELLRKSGASFERALPEEIADYLIANNVVVLPLKVGDTIYRLDLINNKIIDWTVVRIDIYEDEVVYCDDCFNVFTDEEFGVREGVLLSRTEAEAKLKEMLEEKAK